MDAFIYFTFKYVYLSFVPDFTTNECKGKPTGYVRPHPTDCSKFIMCIGDGVQRVLVCPAGLHYNVRYDICDHPYLVSCKISNNVDEKPSSHVTILRNPVPHPKPGIVFPYLLLNFYALCIIEVFYIKDSVKYTYNCILKLIPH